MSPLLALVLLTIATVQAPPETRPRFDGHIETPGEVVARYAEIAQVIVETAETQRAPEGMTKRQGAALLLAMAIGESGLSRDADIGPCAPGRCDGGLSASIWQVHVPQAFKWQGITITREKLFADRRLAARLAYARMRGSIAKCRKLAPKWRLSAYGSGQCFEMQGASDRWALVEKVIASVR